MAPLSLHRLLAPAAHCDARRLGFRDLLQVPFGTCLGSTDLIET
jgi:hypothetical protein